MTSKQSCTRLIEPCSNFRIDPCDCRFYYECTSQYIVRRSCAEGVIFNAKTRNCFFASPKICDMNKPWNRCNLDDFDISSDQIQSESACRKFWPKDMQNWKLTVNTRRKTTERTKTSLMTSTASTAAMTSSTKWLITTNRSISSVTGIGPNHTGNDTQPSRIPVEDTINFDTPAAKTYIPVMVCAMIALVAFVAIIILWKKRSDVKTFVAGLCCVGAKEKSKSIFNPGYGNTIAANDPRLDQTTGENVYHEIPYLNPTSVLNRPLPQTPPQLQQQTVRASTFAGFGCPDVAIRKEQQIIQRTNSACQTYDKLTSSDDRSLIDAQERFANEYQLPSPKRNRLRNMAAQTLPSNRKTQIAKQKAAARTRRGRNRNRGTRAVDRNGALTGNGVGRHRVNSGKLGGIKEDLELSPSREIATESTHASDSESISASGNSQYSLSSEKNNPGVYSGVWDGVSVGGTN